MASGKIIGVGGTVIGTKNSVSCPNNGTNTEIGTITLSKGTWMVIVTGWSPFDETTQSATQIELSYTSVASVTLSRLFNLVGLFTIVNYTDTVHLNVVNWESSSKIAGTNYDFRAVKIA